MSNQQKKNTFYGAAAILTVSTILVKIIGAIFKIPLIAILPEEAYGDFNGAYNIYSFFLTISTAGHPIDPTLREQVMQYNMPVQIGRNCWLGAGVIVMPGVSIGDNSIIGAGSVVTRDIPANVVAVGVPCRVLREIGEHDRKYYWRDRTIDPSFFAE